MNRTGTIGNHNDLVILTTRFRVELITTVTILQVLNASIVIFNILCAESVTANAVLNEVLAKCLTEGISVPQNCLCDVVPCLCLGGVVSEGGAHWVDCLCAYYSGT